MSEYRWKRQVAAGLDAQAVGDHLEQIRHKRKGILTPQAVVKDAKRKRSPLHSCFEWDDTDAAVKYREDQARYLLRNVVVVFDGGTENQKTARAFVTIVTDDTLHYTSLVYAMSQEELRQQIVQRAWKELGEWRERYDEYDELAAVFTAMDKKAA